MTLTLKTDQMNIKEILSRKPPDRLYHYTSPEGLLGIVKQREIWATHTQYLNDVREFSHAVEMAKEELHRMTGRSDSGGLGPVLQSMKDSLAGIESVNVCVVSFSEEGDSLSQWRAYCGEATGFSVGFSGQFLKSIIGDMFWLVPCQYADDVQKQLIKTLLNDVLDENQNRKPQDRDDLPPGGNFLPYLMRYAPILKHQSFQDEKEWRIISRPLPCSSERFEYRAGRSMLIPYYRVSLEAKSEPFTIEQVIIGPTPYPEQSTNSVKSLLAKFRLNDTQIVTSQVPYRNW